MTPATRPRSCTPSFVRLFHGAGSAASPSPASSHSLTPAPGGRSRSAFCRRRRGGRIPCGSGRWAADSRPAGPSAPPGVFVGVYKYIENIASGGNVGASGRSPPEARPPSGSWQPLNSLNPVKGPLIIPHPTGFPSPEWGRDPARPSPCPKRRRRKSSSGKRTNTATSSSIPPGRRRTPPRTERTNGTSRSICELMAGRACRSCRFYRFCRSFLLPQPPAVSSRRSKAFSRSCAPRSCPPALPSPPLAPGRRR